MTARRASESGMTLIETLIALFVIALMATAGAVMTGQTLRGARMLETRGEASGELALALNTLSADLSAYTGRPGQDEALSAPATGFSGHAPRADGRVMLFIRNGWANPAGAVRSDLQRVEYVYDGGNLVRRSWAAPDPGPSTHVEEEVLLSGLARVEARYGRGDVWSSEWISLGSPEDPAPQKAELVLTFSDSDAVTVRYLIGGGT